ncbi:hypothetical protein [Kordiimonas marina]|uniref:hypothetical protein n=1 Tax=Kordiimonas marina TaxID=2872312 RepID=UPI001FF542C8|nr:hypothetical protein [Kordiimonas marina]MCJ9429603.1 hypothetical protein [Kordiimonas marina]
MTMITRVLAGGLVAGFLDISYAIIVYGFKGVPPVRIFQSVAGGLYGRATYDGGIRTALQGGLLHFAMALVMAAVFVAAYDRLSFLQKKTPLWGMAYGLGLFLVMYLVVMPLSAIGMIRIPHGGYFLGALFAHCCLVGLPIALAARGRRPIAAL